MPLLIRDEQWVFPDMQFTCMGILTGWTFRGVPGTNVVTRCRVQLTTWRFDASSSSTAFNRVSTTEGNTATFNVNEMFFTYDLDTPAIVQPGDIVGVEIDNLCGSLQNFDNILGLNVSGSGSTSTVYRRSSTPSRLTVSSVSVSTMNSLIPLVTPIVLPTIGQFIIE